MSFLVSSPLEAVDILALCDYKAQEEICILYTEVSFFYTQNSYTLLKTRRRFQSRENKGPSSSLGFNPSLFQTLSQITAHRFFFSTTGMKNYNLIL